MLIKPYHQELAIGTGTPWQALQYFNLFRLSITTFFVMLVWLTQLPEPLGSHNPLLFAVCTHIYLLLAFCIIFFTQLRKPNYKTQLSVYISIDIIVIQLLMYTSNGIDSGFAMLLVIAIISVSILQVSQLAVRFAAIATLLVLAQEVYIEFFRQPLSANYTHAGFLGLTFFITAFLGQLLSTKIKQSEVLAEQQALNIENLGILNERIIQKMKIGIVVLGDNYQIRLLNQSAERLLGLGKELLPQQVEYTELLSYVDNWQRGNGDHTVIYRSENSYTDVQASFTRLTPASKFDILIFLEDSTQIRQQAQNLKITSLGRLSASIAHEIRNPLAAISHASQLLSESTTMNKEESNLTNIITEHSKRINKIIENMQQISKRKAAIPEYTNISTWLADFIADFMKQKQLGKTDIHVRSSTQTISVHIDSSQLYQIIWNLSENALQHSQPPPGQPLIEYQWGVRALTDRSYLDIIDHGAGMDDKIITQLFEPFFTTTDHGSGLGLYISRELCEANQASLVLHRNSNQGCCFRIYFSHKNEHGNLLS